MPSRVHAAGVAALVALLSRAGVALKSGGDHCTAMAVGCKATVDGSCMATTSADGSPLDFRLVHVPAKDHAEGSVRPVYLQKQDYPRYVDAERAPAYAPVNGQMPSVPIGQIAQVAHTYAYWDATYGVQNEHQLSMGESSCSAKLTAAPRPNGTALFEVGELTDIAMERCKTARCAIQTMGDLAYEHGFYGTTDVTEAGEALTIADTEEVWVFHILADDTGRKAIWVAKRVPSDEATVVPNVFVIREVDPDDTENVMHSPNMLSVARKLGWWDGHSPFDFTAVYSPGEYMHPYYAGRRIWRALSLFAPSMKLDPKVGVNATVPGYPFSVRPDRPVSHNDIFRIYRDHLEGTEFDLSKGVAAGPFNTPNRYDPGPNEAAVPYGAWERGISLYRTAYSYVATARKNATAGGILHFGVSQPHASVYVPLFTSLLTDAPKAVTNGSNARVSQDSLWWAVTSLANLMDVKYSYMIKDVQEFQRSLESVHEDAVKVIDAAADPLGKDREILAKRNVDLVEGAKEQVWGLFWEMMAKYQNGYADYGATKVGYSSAWLKAAGFDHFAASKEQFDRQRADFAEAQRVADVIRNKHPPVVVEGIATFV